jgi:hypothetical protein
LDYLETDFFDFQIPSNNISFDAPSAGDAHGTLYFCIWAVLSLKTGVRRVEPYKAYVGEHYRGTRFFIFQISSNNNSFDAPSDGDAGGTLRFCRGALLRRIGEASTPHEAKRGASVVVVA